MRKILNALVILPFLFITSPVFAVNTPSEITNYTSSTLNLIIAVASAAAIFLLVKGGYLYMSSSGNPDGLDSGKRTIKNALIGLVIVLAAVFFVSVFRNAAGTPPIGTSTSAISIAPLQSAQPQSGLTVVLTDAISGVFQLLITSALMPIINAVITYLTSTPTLLNNSVIMQFWLLMLGITDSLFVLVVALLGLRFMAAESLGFDQIELRHLLPRIGLAFIGANASLFLANEAIVLCNALVSAVLNSTGGLSKALLVDAINPVTSITQTTPFITLVFLLLFLIVSLVLLFMYIGRLIMISLGAVLSPFIFLMWAMPKFSDFAEIAVKSYLVTVFTIFVHVVVIQIASAFLTVPGGTDNSVVAVIVGVGLLFSLLKIPSMLFQMAFYTSGFASISRMGKQMMNVMSTDKGKDYVIASSTTGGSNEPGGRIKKARAAMSKSYR